MLHHNGSWSHEGCPILHERLRAAFDRSVRYLPEEGKYVVQLGRFRGQIEVEEAAFFVRALDLESGELALSDGSREALESGSLHPSPRDGALLCRVRRDGVAGGLLARFEHGAQAELLLAVQEAEGGSPWLLLAGRRVELPPL